MAFWRRFLTLSRVSWCFLPFAWSVEAPLPFEDSLMDLSQIAHGAFLLSRASFLYQILKSSWVSQSSTRYFYLIDFFILSLYFTIMKNENEYSASKTCLTVKNMICNFRKPCPQVWTITCHYYHGDIICFLSLYV